MNTQIRKATKSDIKVLKDLSKKTINANYRTFLGDEPVDAFIDSGAVDKYVDENIESCSVILSDGNVAGYAVTKDNLIDLMMIDDDFHRRGLGTKILEYCEEMLFKNYDELILESFEENHKANNFYKKNGWTETKRRFDKSSGVNKVVFCKKL